MEASMQQLSRFAALAASGLVLAGCSSYLSRPTPYYATAPAAPVAAASGIPAPNGDQIQYFRVPSDGRAALMARLETLAGGPGAYSDVRISNAWRTAASAQVTPNDYAACVSATTGRGIETWMIVVSGTGTGDAIGGAAGAKRCGDPTRVQNWEEIA
jgi:hypothetical protein